MPQGSVKHDRKVASGYFYMIYCRVCGKAQIKRRLAGGRIIPSNIRRVQVPQYNCACRLWSHTIICSKRPGIIAEHKTVCVAVADIQLGPFWDCR